MGEYRDMIGKRIEAIQFDDTKLMLQLDDGTIVTIEARVDWQHELRYLITEIIDGARWVR